MGFRAFLKIHSRFMPITSWETWLPMGVIQRILHPTRKSHLSRIFRSSSGRLAGRKNNPSVRFRRLFPPKRCASGADPSRRKDSLTLDCVTTRGPVSVVAAGSCPFVSPCGAPQTRAPYRYYVPRNQSRGLWRSPAPSWRGACLPVPTRSSFRDGYPSPYERCESRRNSLLADGQGDSTFC